MIRVVMLTMAIEMQLYDIMAKSLNRSVSDVQKITFTSRQHP